MIDEIDFLWYYKFTSKVNLLRGDALVITYKN